MEGDQGKTEQKGNLEGEIVTASRADAESLRSAEFVKVEKNLASLGFFTPSSKRLRNAQEKSFTITTVADGTRLELKGTIIPSAKYGLPITADQDKWIALCKILNDIMQREGKVTNPVSFTSAEILRLLHKHRHSGKNYKEVEEWLDVLFSTTIFSEGVVYLAGEKRRGKDRFRVFERAVSLGKELPDGKVADKNYVWFSDWQLQNINSNHLLPIDLDAYRELKNHISKALVPLLQVWLYATRDEGVFEKRYDELCQILNIQQYHYPSLIRRTLAPSLDELKLMGYLADWQVEKTTDGENFKIIFYHGEKFHRDRRARLTRKRAPDAAGEQSRNAAPAGTNRTPPGSEVHAHGQRAPRPSPTWEPAVYGTVLAELVKRGITDSGARTLLAEIHPDQPILRQLEWGDRQIEHGKIENPAGFFISLIKGNVMPPPTFETRVQREAREEQERREADERKYRQEIETEHHWYCEDELDRYIASLDPAELVTLRAAKRETNRERHTWLSEDAIDKFAEIELRLELKKRLPLMTIEEFEAHRKQGIIPKSDLTPGPAPAETPTTEPASSGQDTPLVTPEASVTPSSEPMVSAIEEPPPAELNGALHDAAMPTESRAAPPAIEMSSDPPQDTSLPEEGPAPLFPLE